MISRERKIELLKRLKKVCEEVDNFLDEEIAALENQELFEDNGTLETALQLAEEKAKEKFIKLNDETTERYSDADSEYFEAMFFSLFGWICD